MSEAILTLNAGSSSLKFSLFEFGPDRALRLMSEGQVEGIGTAPRFIANSPDGAVLAEHRWPDTKPDYNALIENVTSFAESHLGRDQLIAVGHRVVHGGPDHDRPQRVTPELLTALDRLIPLAPLHEPHNIAPMRAMAAARPALPQVACFDTAFHHNMPVVATRFALPRQYEAEGVRRYGFHGLSYEFIASRLRELAPDLARGRVIAAHLGNGASLCAMRDGCSVDTTMSFTALDGLVMGTRGGNLDPGVVLYLEQQHGMTAEAVEHLLYNESGLLGVSGISSDMRALLASSDGRAREAIELFVFRIAREIGAMIASLGGVDGIVFTAGIGEHSPEIRTMVSRRLGWLGAMLDETANGRGALRISTPESRVALYVVPTSEETMIAQHTLDIVRPA
jgi:acetate kinase